MLVIVCVWFPRRVPFFKSWSNTDTIDVVISQKSLNKKKYRNLNKKRGRIIHREAPGFFLSHFFMIKKNRCKQKTMLHSQILFFNFRGRGIKQEQVLSLIAIKNRSSFEMEKRDVLNFDFLFCSLDICYRCFVSFGCCCVVNVDILIHGQWRQDRVLTTFLDLHQL